MFQQGFFCNVERGRIYSQVKVDPLSYQQEMKHGTVHGTWYMVKITDHQYYAKVFVSHDSFSNTAVFSRDDEVIKINIFIYNNFLSYNGEIINRQNGKKKTEL